MTASAERVFERHFDVQPVPAPPRQVVLTDRVHPVVAELAESLGLEAIDLTRTDVVTALRGLEGQKFAAILGRGDFDKAVKSMPDKEVRRWFDSMRSRNGLEMIVRLGNGVGMDTQAAFDNGIVIERTPGGNAESVRIWQDLLLLHLHQGDLSIHDGKNPATEDDSAVKFRGSTNPLKWNREEVSSAVTQPHTEEAERCVDLYRGKKVVVIGGGGIIGREVIANSVFLKEADIHVFDPGLDADGEGFKVHGALEDALQDAELVLLHNAGDKEILGASELALMKRGAKVCNVSRGGCVNPRALYEALESGHLSGAGLDVHVAEKKEVQQYLNPPADVDEWQPGHWAVMLRNHPRVCATNHSAASEAMAEEINAQDAMVQVHRYLTRGEIAHAMALPYAEFPYAGFVSDSESGAYSPMSLSAPRYALQVLHDGHRPGVMAGALTALARFFESQPQVWSAELRNRVMPPGPGGAQRENGSFSLAFDLPHTASRTMFEDEKMPKRLVDTVGGLQGVRRARLFRVERKAGA